MMYWLTRRKLIGVIVVGFALYCLECLDLVNDASAVTLVIFGGLGLLILTGEAGLVWVICGRLAKLDKDASQAAIRRHELAYVVPVICLAALAGVIGHSATKTSHYLYLVNAFMTGILLGFPILLEVRRITVNRQPTREGESKAKRALRSAGTAFFYVLGGLAVLYFLGCVHTCYMTRDWRTYRWRRLGISNVYRSIRQYESEYGVLPYSPKGSSGALFALEGSMAIPVVLQYRYDGKNIEFRRDEGQRIITGAGYVLWVGEVPQSSQEVTQEQGDDFIIAAEAFPFQKKDLYVITAGGEWRTHLIRCKTSGAEVVGTWLSEHERPRR